MTQHGFPGGIALDAHRLTLRRRRRTILDDVTFRLPAGRVCGLVGPNGAGKSTLLDLAAGLLRPTSGDLRVLGRRPGAEQARHKVAFVAQDKPLYDELTVAQTLRLGRDLNPVWRPEAAERVLGPHGPAPSTRVGRLSEGQRSRIALALAVGRAPDLLLLDEPLAYLDPLARHEVMGALMADAAERGTTVLLSSHVVAELDGVIDHLLLLDAGRLRLAGETDELLAAHRLLSGPQQRPDGSPAHLPAPVVERRVTGRRLTALVQAVPGAHAAPDREWQVSEWQVSEPRLDEVLLGYLRSPQAPPLLTGGQHGLARNPLDESPADEGPADDDPARDGWRP